MAVQHTRDRGPSPRVALHLCFALAVWSVALSVPSAAIADVPPGPPPAAGGARIPEPKRRTPPLAEVRGHVTGALLGGSQTLSVESLEYAVDAASWAQAGPGRLVAKYTFHNDTARAVDVPLSVTAPPGTSVQVRVDDAPRAPLTAPSAPVVSTPSDDEPTQGAPFSLRVPPGRTTLALEQPLSPSIWGRGGLSTSYRVALRTKLGGPLRAVGPTRIRVVGPAGWLLTTSPPLTATGARSQGAAAVPSGAAVLEGTFAQAPDLFQVRAQKVNQLASTLAGPMGGFFAFAFAFIVAFARVHAARRGPRTRKRVCFAWAMVSAALGCGAAFGLQLVILSATGVTDPGDVWYTYAAFQYGAAFVLGGAVVFAFLASRNGKLAAA